MIIGADFFVLVFIVGTYYILSTRNPS